MRVFPNSGSKGFHKHLIILAGSLTLALCAGHARAQSPGYAFETKWLAIGSYQHHYHAGGAVQHVAGFWGMHWPGWDRWSSNQNGQALWMGAKNFVDENGEEWPHKVSHMGYRANGVGEVFPQGIVGTSRLDPPEVILDGLASFNRPVVYDHISSDLESDALVEKVVNSEIGLTLTRRIWGFSQEYHDNYHIIEDVYTNTGEVDGGRTVPEQTLEDVFVAMVQNYSINDQLSGIIPRAGWGQSTVNDMTFGDGTDEDIDTDFRAQYSWQGHQPLFTEWNTIGGPLLSDRFGTVPAGDSLGRLTAAHFAGHTTIHADTSPTDPTNDTGQPRILATMYHGGGLATNDSQNREWMANEYEFFEGRTTNPNIAFYSSHANFLMPPEDHPGLSWRERMARQGLDGSDPGIDIEGRVHAMAYGPYTIEPGESIRIVRIVGVAGLDDRAKRDIGLMYRQAWLDGDEHRELEYEVGGQVHSMSKNEWVLTSRDSIFQMFERARANYESGFAIPRPPEPPQRLEVTSETDQIRLEWEMYPGADQVGFELYRTSGRVENEYELIAGMDDLGPGARQYIDSDVDRGIGYFYYLQAVGEVNNDDTGLTPTGVRLRSNRVFTQTYDGATLKRPPGGTLADARVVPNPYNLASVGDVRWPDQQDRIGFLDLPGNATIRIYTEIGELIETIEHTDGSGDAFWNLTTSSNQVVVSGIYLAAIQDNDTGEQAILKFVIIR